VTTDDARDAFVVALARRMRPQDRVFLGTNQGEVALAAYLARRLWAPRLRFWTAGAAQVDPARDHLLVGRRTYDRTTVAARGSSFWQARAFDDALRAPVVFAGGLQVDGRGNANLVGIRRQDRTWALRGPGSAGLPSLTALAERFFVMVPVHDARALVERVSAISVLGDPRARAAVGIRPDALTEVITPLASFVPSVDGLLLSELAEGVAEEEVAQRTGFEFRTASDVSVRSPVADDEKEALRALRAAAAANGTR
jgi:glutaconate CoA-transferase subunit B